MNLNEKSMQYADGKINEILTNAIAKAYADGYEQGYEDRSKEIPVELPKDDAEYVDLGLPSGTLWAKDYVKEEGGLDSALPYCKAEGMKLPTREQAAELMEKCYWSYTQSNGVVTFKAFGPNGNEIEFRQTGIVGPEGRSARKEVYLWLVKKDSEVKPCSLNISGEYCVNKGFYSQFPGLRLAVRLVK